MRKQATVFLLFLWASGRAASGEVYTVTNSANSGAGTLRVAITSANTNPGADTIQFNLPAGSRTITLTTELPRLTERAAMDGTSQPGYLNAPLLSLTASGTLTNGLVLDATGCEVSGLCVSGFSDAIRANSNSCVIRACHVVSNSNAGVHIRAGGCRVLDNYAGGNQVGIHVELGNTVGGIKAGSRNVISGNTAYGIKMAAVADPIANNLQNYPTITNVFVDGANLRIQGRLISGITKGYKLNFGSSAQFVGESRWRDRCWRDLSRLG